MTVSQQATPEQNAAYIKGICIDCQQVPYSAGRPRCGDCNAKHFDRHSPPPEEPVTQKYSSPRVAAAAKALARAESIR